MKIAIVGYQGSGKSTLFQWLTGFTSDPSQAHQGQTAMAAVPDDRIERLNDILQSKKVTRASLQLVDMPGLSRTDTGNAGWLAEMRDAGALVVVLAAFDGSDPIKDSASLDEDLLLADLAIVSGRVERLRQSINKPRPSREQEMAELATLEPLVSHLESGTRLSTLKLSDDQTKAVRSFGLLTQKPRLLMINTADDEENPKQWTDRLLGHETGSRRVEAIPIGLQLELARMDERDRMELVEEMKLEICDPGVFLRTILAISDQLLFFTGSEKELRTWLVRQGCTALEAAATIHTDLARGFIRAETMASDDLIRLGSEREMKSHHLVRLEPKNYVVQDGDILNIKFNV